MDNVLFRPEDDAVLLDWSGAAIGPPAVDLARLLTEGVNAGWREDLAAELVSAYASELARGGVTVVIEDLWDALSKSLALLVQAAVGWAAREEDRPPVARMRALQEQLLRSVFAWASNEQMTKPGHVFAL
jgi:thiamine kinase-like enzyme